MKTSHFPLRLIIGGALAAAIFSCAKSTPKKSTTTVLTVSTLAGTGNTGAVNGIGTAASFNNPSALALGSAGLLVGDWGNSLVRAINLGTSAVSTFAGTGTLGLVNGPAASAEFNGTAAIALDKQGNLFISDEENQVIREVTAAGNVITVAGTPGVIGLNNGPAATATFYHPDGIAIDANGDLYIADNQNQVIRKITMSTGMVSTYAGTGAVGLNNGAVATATFNSPYGLTLDGNGDLYVAEPGNCVIRKITVSTSMVSTYAGAGTHGYADGPAAAAQFNAPIACVFDGGGDLYVSDFFNNVIRKISSGGATVSTYAGSATAGATDGPAASASFNHPIGLALDANGALYVADEHNSKIRKISLVTQ